MGGYIKKDNERYESFEDLKIINKYIKKYTLTMLNIGLLHFIYQVQFKEE